MIVELGAHPNQEKTNASFRIIFHLFTMFNLTVFQPESTKFSNSFNSQTGVHESGLETGEVSPMIS